jgi:chromate reductase, NAD(P)H dehydrogenase (quinone)
VTKLLLISGSLRGGSTNSATLRTAAALAPPGIETETYDGMGRLPHFNPDDDPTDGVALDGEVATLRAALAEADALLLSTPEYAGALPGSFKNLLDWSVGGPEMYEKPVAWINASTRAAAHAHDSLRTVLGYIHAEIVEAACVHVPIPRQAVGADGLIGDEEIRAGLRKSLDALLAHMTQM